MTAANQQKIPSKIVLYLRAIAWWLVFTISTLLLTLPVLIGLLLSYEKGFRVIDLWLAISLNSLKWICKLDCNIVGLEDMPEGAKLVLSKHQSTFETLLLPAILKSSVFVAKRELALIPCFGWCLYMTDTILIKRGAGKSVVRQLQEESAKRFSRDRCVVMFPEGTRREPNAEPEYKMGGALIAHKLEMPITPIAHNAGEYWPRHSFIKWPGTIEVRIGPAIPVAGKSPDQIMNDVIDWIETQQKEITVVDRFPY